MVDASIDVERGRVAGFTLQYRARIRGRWVQVIRFDTCHGHLHVHRFWSRMRPLVDLEDPAWPAVDYTRALRDAKADVAQNWFQYRRRMED